MYYNFPTIIHVKDRHYYDEKKAIYTEDELGVSNLNVDGLNAEGYEMDKQRLQMYVGRYITNAKGYLKNVCNGVFPKIDRKQRRHVGRK